MGLPVNSTRSWQQSWRALGAEWRAKEQQEELEKTGHHEERQVKTSLRKTMDSRLVMSGVVGGLAVALLTRRKPSSAVRRFHTKDPRSSSMVVHNDMVYVSGQVGIIENIGHSDVVQQTQETLVKIENLLAEVGTNKSNILEARIWLKDIKRDFAAMNGVWNAWVDQESKGVRYCVESHLARENLLVEIQVVATL